MTVTRNPDGSVTFACTRGRRNGRRGSSGSPPLPNECPAGLDPVRYCDVVTRKPSPYDARYYVCTRCGKTGKWEVPA